MKKIYLLLVVLATAYIGFAQPLTGNKTINPVGGDYISFTAAINALNTNGVGTGGVIFNVPTGTVFIENPPTIKATGTLDNPVVFQKSGAGSNPQLQPGGSSAATDFGIKDSTADYYTFDGIDIVASGNLVEFGYYLQGSANNGVTNVVIKNCAIALNTTATANTAQKAIYMQSAATSAAGANSNNKFYNININNSYNGYHLAGNSTYPDDNTVINTQNGGTGSVKNIGNTTGTSQANGIIVASQTNLLIANQIIQNISATTAQIAGINQSGSATTATYSGNTITAVASTTGAAYGIIITGGKTHTIFNNSITDIAATTGLVAGISMSATSVNNFYNNNISNLRNTTATSNAVYGITNSGAGVTMNAYNNIVSNIVYGGASTGFAAGLNLSGTSTRIYNNVVYNILASNSTAKPGARGIMLGGGTSVIACLHNTVYLDGTVATATSASAALYLTANANFDIRNNIFVNTGSNPSGAKIAAQYRAGTYTNFTAATDNNLYYAGTPGANNLIFYDGTNADQTLAAFQTRAAGKEQHSVTEMPVFLSASGTYNLHLSASVPTQCESGGQAITTPFVLNKDADGNSRGATYVDMGAYEGTYTRNDLTGPYITYTPLINTTQFLTPRTIVATIQDPSGVATSGIALPVLYWKVNSGAYTAATATYISAGTYSFSFGGTANTGEVVSYYVAAQDQATAANTGAWPSATAYTTNPPAASTAPVTPYTYNVLAIFENVVNVGVGQTYTSLTGTGGLFEALNNNILTHNVVAKITSDLTETGTNDLKQWLEEGEGTLGFSVKIIPATNSIKNIVGNVTNNTMIRLNGVKKVTIDGSPDRLGNYLLFRNTSSDYPTFQLSNDASKDSVVYCIIEGNYQYSQLGVFTIGNGTVTGNDSNVVSHNIIRSRSDITTATATNMFYSIGTSLVTNSGNEFSHNLVGNFNINGFCSVEGNENWLVKGNEFYQTVVGSNTVFAIHLGSQGNNLITGNSIHDLKFTSSGGIMAGILLESAGTTEVSKNRIFGFPSNDGQVNGILFWGSSASPVKANVINNQISMNMPGTTGQVLYGIHDDSYAIDTLNACYNTVYIGGNGGGVASNNSWAYYRGGVSGAATNTIRNNIFFNDRTGNQNFALGNEKHGVANVGAFTVSNNLYIGKTATSQAFMQMGSTAASAVSFADWVAANRDISSYALEGGTLNPIVFFSDLANDNLNINTTVVDCWYVHGKGLALAGIGDDCNTANRRSTNLSAGSTDIGANEFTTTILPPVMNLTGVHALGQTESFDFAGRTLGSITWGSTGTLPSLGSIRHYTGQWPNDPTVGARYLNEWWDIPATGGNGYTYSIRLDYDSAMLGTIANEATMILNKKQSGVAGTWTNILPTTVNTNTKMLQATGLASFSEFTASDLNNPLPIALVSFQATPVASDVRLQWTTANEVDHQRFEVQRSTNGRDFISFANVAGNGSSNGQNRYQTMDANAMQLYKTAGRIYYRLKSVAIDGSITYSNIVLVSMQGNSQLVQAILPNPFASSFGIAIYLPAAEKVTVRLMAQDGRMVLVKTFQPATGYSTLDLQQLDHLAKGIYTLEVISGDQKVTKQMMKQ